MDPNFSLGAYVMSFGKVSFIWIFSLVIAANLASGSDRAKRPSSATIMNIDKRYESLETLARGLFLLETMYVDPDKVDQATLVTNALAGVVDKLDPHTMVMPQKAFQQLTIDTQGKFGGIGIIVSHERGKLTVVSPIDDTPAHRAGIKAGDEILAIDDITIAKLKESDAVDRMRGAPGSKIKLTIKREGQNKNLTFSLKREVIKVKSVRGQMLSDSLIYARITSFQENTTSELKELIKKLSKNQPKGMILDLRDNPGGLLDQAVGISDMFIESGLIVSTVGRDPKRVEREFAHKRNTLVDFPMIVLINGGSASASEIVAGALQDHERALVLGTTSFGKGSVQTLLSLPNGSGLKLTIARYYTPKDRSIQAKGIQPDILVYASQKENKDSKSKKDHIRKESDLKGHIESKDLSDLSKQGGIMTEVKKWPSPMRNDFQLVSAFSYLRSYSMFSRPRNKAKP